MARSKYSTASRAASSLCEVQLMKVTTTPLTMICISRIPRHIVSFAIAIFLNRDATLSSLSIPTEALCNKASASESSNFDASKVARLIIVARSPGLWRSFCSRLCRNLASASDHVASAFIFRVVPFGLERCALFPHSSPAKSLFVLLDPFVLRIPLSCGNEPPTIRHPHT